MKLEVKKYQQRWRKFLEYTSVDIGVDLHDDISALKRPDFHPQRGYRYIPRTETTFHFCDSKSRKEYNHYEEQMEPVITKLQSLWNEQNKTETIVGSCSCYEVYRRGCGMPLVTVEFHNLDGRLKVEEGVRYVGTLVRYLLTNF